MSEQFIRDAKLRVQPGEFEKQLRALERRRVGPWSVVEGIASGTNRALRILFGALRDDRTDVAVRRINEFARATVGRGGKRGAYKKRPFDFAQGDSWWST